VAATAPFNPMVNVIGQLQATIGSGHHHFQFASQASDNAGGFVLVHCPPQSSAEHPPLRIEGESYSRKTCSELTPRA
jgi:hypothetical protein